MTVSRTIFYSCVIPPTCPSIRETPSETSPIETTNWRLLLPTSQSRRASWDHLKASRVSPNSDNGFLSHYSRDTTQEPSRASICTGAVTRPQRCPSPGEICSPLLTHSSLCSSGLWIWGAMAFLKTPSLASTIWRPWTLGATIWPLSTTPCQPTSSGFSCGTRTLKPWTWPSCQSVKTVCKTCSWTITADSN